jgi:hypothetical protein
MFVFKFHIQLAGKTNEIESGIFLSCQNPSPPSAVCFLLFTLFS